MLILTRRIGEAIKIGDDIAITVLRIKGNQVRIGIDAPKTMSVRRDELDRRDDSATDNFPRPDIEPRE